MREIKFRLWDKEKKVMIPNNGDDYEEEYCYLVMFIGGSLALCWSQDDDVFFKDVSDKYEIMQFTGLKDSKGKEIYEGDIVRFYEQGYDPNEPDEERIEPETTTVFIYWNENGKCLAIDWDYEDSRFAPVGWGYEWILNSEFDYHEVIGNIYENPELLKEVDPRDMGYYAEKK